MGAEKAVPLLGLHPLPGVVLRNPPPGPDPPDAPFPGGQYAHYRATGLPHAAPHQGACVAAPGPPPPPPPTAGRPAAYWRAVTVLCADSGLADALSTALFTLPQAEGQALLDRYGAEAMWVDASGGEVFSPGFSAYLRT